MSGSGSAPKRPPHILLLMMRPPRFVVDDRAIRPAASRSRAAPGAFCRGGRRHSGRAGGGIRDCPPAKQSGRRGLRAGGRDRRPDRAAGAWRSRGARRGADAVSAFPISPSRMPKATSGRSRIGAAAPSSSTSGRPGACPAARRCRRSTRSTGRAGRARVSRWSPSISTPAMPKSRSLFSRTPASSTWPIIPTRAPRCFRSLKIAGKAFGMPTTLIIDRSGCEIGEMAGTRRMGERRRRQACERGARQHGLIAGSTRHFGLSRRRHQPITSRFAPIPLATPPR